MGERENRTQKLETTNGYAFSASNIFFEMYSAHQFSARPGATKAQQAITKRTLKTAEPTIVPIDK